MATLRAQRADFWTATVNSGQGSDLVLHQFASFVELVKQI